MPDETRPSRLSVNIGTEPAAALQEYMDRHDVSATEAVRRAISVLKFVDDELRAGRELATREPNGAVRVVDFPEFDAAAGTGEERNG